MTSRTAWKRLAFVGAAALVAAACSSTKPASRRSVPGSGHAIGTTATTAVPGTSADRPTTPSSTLVAISEPWRLPVAVSRPVVLADGPKFLILGGLATGDVSTARIVQVDPGTGNSELAGSLALAVHDSAGALLGGRAFLFGGGSYSTVARVQAWTSGTASEVGRLPDARSDLAAVTLDGTAYIVGGFDGSTMTPQVLATTDGVTYRTVAQLSIPVRYAAVAGLGRTLWVVGGVTSTSEGGTEETDAVQKVDLETGQTTVVGHLPAPMGHATALTMAGAVFVIGGRSGAVPSAAILRLDPTSGQLQPAGRLPMALSDAGSVVVGGVGYLVGGEVSGPAAPLDSVVQLRPGA